MNIGQLIDDGWKLWVNCEHPACARSAKVDLVALAARLGRDHGTMHWDLKDKFVCSRCSDEGRVNRGVFFTCTPDCTIQTTGPARWQRPDERQDEPSE